MLGSVNRKIGILDDNDDSRVMLRYWLETQGFEVSEYSRKSDFVDRIQYEELQVVLVDLMLPDGSGLDIPAELKRHTGRDIPVIAVTAHAMPGVFEQASNAGFSAFIPKPVNFTTLLTAIHQHMR